MLFTAGVACIHVYIHVCVCMHSLRILFLPSLLLTVEHMDSILERPTSPRVLSTTAPEVEPGLVSSITNDWGPTQYDRNHHPLHIMVNRLHLVLYSHIQCVCTHYIHVHTCTCIYIHTICPYIIIVQLMSDIGEVQES